MDSIAFTCIRARTHTLAAYWKIDCMFSKETGTGTHRLEDSTLSLSRVPCLYIKSKACVSWMDGGGCVCVCEQCEHWTTNVYCLHYELAYAGIVWTARNTSETPNSIAFSRVDALQFVGSLVSAIHRRPSRKSSDIENSILVNDFPSSIFRTHILFASNFITQQCFSKMIRFNFAVRPWGEERDADGWYRWAWCSSYTVR